MQRKSLALFAATVALAVVVFGVLRAIAPGVLGAVAPAESAEPRASERGRVGPEARANAFVAGDSGRDASESPGPADGPPASSDPADALARIAAVGARLGPELDLVTAMPELVVLWELRELVEDAGLSAETLLDESAELALGDPRARALTLAAAWGGKPDAATDARLLALARHAARADPSLRATEEDQHALAAVWALDLGQRTQALETLGRELVETALADRDAARGDLALPGLTNLRAWFALRALEAPDAAAWSAAFESLPGGGDDRVSKELWALAARSDPERGAAALAYARAGRDAARSGIEALTDERFTPELAELALESTRSPAAAWLASSALRALAATASDESLTALGAALELDAVRRDQALEALRTWRPARHPARQIAALCAFANALEADADARLALEEGIARALSWAGVRRLDDAARLELEAALASVDDRSAASDLKRRVRRLLYGPAPFRQELDSSVPPTGSRRR